MKKQKIITHLWFDKEAKEAAQLYTSIFNNSKIKYENKIEGTPSGSVDILTIELAGQELTLFSAGPLFKFNPSVSLLVACDTKEEVDSIWGKLSVGGSVLMEKDSYPFSERYGWLQDKFGLSWQIMFMGNRRATQKIIPTLMFVGNMCGQAEEAMKFYTSIFDDTHVGEIMRYGKDEAPDKAGTVKHAVFFIENQEFAAMDSAGPHNFSFNEAVSFMVKCDTQAEIDYYWGKLSAVLESEQCGWLKDKFGFSWQIAPANMDEMLSGGDKEKTSRVTEAFLEMKKIDLAALNRASEGK